MMTKPHERWNLDMKERIAQVETWCANHVLTPLIETPPVKCYRVGRRGERNYSFLVTFDPEGIVLQGDITPEPNGSTSRGKDLWWFAANLSPDYLAEKFLQPRVTVERAKYDLDTMLDDLLDDPTDWNVGAAAAIRRAQRQVDNGDLDGAAHTLNEEGLNDERSLGFGYDPQQVVVLAGLQRTFSRLWWKRHDLLEAKARAASGQAPKEENDGK